VLKTDIGEDSRALLCTTDNPNCCSDTEMRNGEFYFPIQSSKSGETVPVLGNAIDGYYRDRQTQHIRLRRQESQGHITGLFRCEIPASNQVIMDLYINIGRCMHVHTSIIVLIIYLNSQ
jgi:hypothetical protein